MKKHLLLTTAVLLGLVGCTDERFGGQNVQKADGSLAIKMGTGSTQPFTRAPWTGKDAADRLGNNFIVEGFKSQAATTEGGTLLTSPVEVFKYYNVNYKDGTAYSTESNTHNWEYVGQVPVKAGDEKTNEFIKDAVNPVANQTIKYWDTDYARYDFVAFSRGEGTAETQGTPAGEPKTFAQFSAVTPTNIGKAAAETSNAVYTIQGSNAEIGAAYVADLVTVFNNTNKTAYLNANPVTPLFRKVAAKVRMAIYETVPGYSVKDVRFYTSAEENAKTTADVSGDGTELNGNKPTLIAVEADDNLSDELDPFKKNVEAFPDPKGSGTLSVFYPVICNEKSDLEGESAKEGCNKAVVTYTPGGTEELETTLSFSDLKYGGKEANEKNGSGSTETEFLGRTSNTATYAGATDESTESAYIDVIPTGTSHTLKLRVAYTLVPIDGGDEVIVMEDATAIVPAIYTNWQSNYAYTYIFKISEKSGEGLYPITFDALVMNDEDGIQETITEVSKPSITTYQFGKVVTKNDEYVKGEPIYVMVNDGEEMSIDADDFYKEHYVSLYTVTVQDGALQPITEATVDNCFFNGVKNTEGNVTTWTTAEDANEKKMTLTESNTLLSITGEIPAKDAPHGITIKKDKAIATIDKSAPAGIYAFQYLVTRAEYSDVKQENCNTIKKDADYYVVTPNNGGYTISEQKQAQGNELITDNIYSEAPSLNESNKVDGVNQSVYTLKKGEKYYTQDENGNYKEFIAVGSEDWAENKYYPSANDATLKKATGTITANTDFYVKSGDTYTKKNAGTDGITVQANDPYYILNGTPAPVIQNNCKFLKAGETYFKMDGTNIEMVVAKGNEDWSSTDYYTAVTNGTQYTGDHTLAKDETYYTFESNVTTGKPIVHKAEGNETKDNATNYFVIKKPAEYAWKVIKVVDPSSSAKKNR